MAPKLVPQQLVKTISEKSFIEKLRKLYSVSERPTYPDDIVLPKELIWTFPIKINPDNNDTNTPILPPPPTLSELSTKYFLLSQEKEIVDVDDISSCAASTPLARREESENSVQFVSPIKKEKDLNQNKGVEEQATIGKKLISKTTKIKKKSTGLKRQRNIEDYFSRN